MSLLDKMDNFEKSDNPYSKTTQPLLRPSKNKRGKLAVLSCLVFFIFNILLCLMQIGINLGLLDDEISNQTECQSLPISGWSEEIYNLGEEDSFLSMKLSSTSNCNFYHTFTYCNLTDLGGIIIGNVRGACQEDQLYSIFIEKYDACNIKSLLERKEPKNEYIYYEAFAVWKYFGQNYRCKFTDEQKKPIIDLKTCDYFTVLINQICNPNLTI